jgi:anti-sigma B factor antagonist
LAEETALVVVVDLRRVEFLAAAGLRVLMAAEQRARAQDTTLRVLAGTHAVGRALSVTGLDRTLTVYFGLDRRVDGLPGPNPVR